MSAEALANLGTQINALGFAIEAARRSSTFELRTKINAVLIGALNVQTATHAVVADLEARVVALEAGRNAAT